jgi:hypothetical protein
VQRLQKGTGLTDHAGLQRTHAAAEASARRLHLLRALCWLCCTFVALSWVWALNKLLLLLLLLLLLGYPQAGAPTQTYDAMKLPSNPLLRLQHCLARGICCFLVANWFARDPCWLLLLHLD